MNKKDKVQLVEVHFSTFHVCIIHALGFAG